MEERVEKILSFLKEIEKFKTIERKTLTSNLKRAESDADHSWHLAMFLILFEKDFDKSLDMMKMLKMALIHDLAEIYAGDVFAFDKNKGNKKERELDSAEKLFSQLPKDLYLEFMNLFKEYENIESPEAKFVKAFDKIQLITQNICSNGECWKKYKISSSDIDNYKIKFVEHDKFVLKIYESLMDEAKREGLI